MPMPKFLFRSCVVLLAGAGFLSPAASGAETTSTFKSTGTSFVVLENNQMADGRIEQQFHVQFIETITDGLGKGETRGGQCAGMGIVDAAGVYAGHFLCTASETKDDAITTEWHDSATGGDWVITGGKGKYAGAKGKGHSDYTWGDAVFGDRLTFAGEGTITLP